MSKRERVEKSKLRSSIVCRLNIFKQAVKLTSQLLLLVSGSCFLLSVLQHHVAICVIDGDIKRNVHFPEIDGGSKKSSNNNYDSFLPFRRALVESLQG
jgi:hypothetical protein